MKQRLFLSLMFLIASCALYAQSGLTLSEDYPLQPSYEITGMPEIEDNYLLFVPLGAYGSPFTTLADYNFSFVRYTRRGYDYGYDSNTLNGISLNNPISGNTSWNILSVLRNIAAPKVVSESLLPFPSVIGSVSGIDAYNASAGEMPKISRLTLQTTDRGYRVGGRILYSSGWLKGGWAVSLAASRRYGRDSRIEGLYSDNWSTFGSVEKRLGSRSSISLLFITAPTEQSVRGGVTTEVVELTSDELYNPYWGYQNGKVRAARIRRNNQPLAIMSWKYTPNSQFRVTSSISYQWGENSYSSLDWYTASDPYPDYYRYMPGFLANPILSADVRAAWAVKDPKITQIDWGELYRANGNRTAEGDPAAYVMSSDVNRLNNSQFVAQFSYEQTPFISWSGGVKARMNRETNFRRLEDLLGGEYLSDIDPYIIDDEYYGDKVQNNLREPNRRVKEGDSYGYFYDLNLVSYGAWALVEFGSTQAKGRLNGYVGLDLEEVAMERDGHYEKELFTGNASLGQSGTHYFTNLMFKGGVSYLASPANIISANIAYGTLAPTADQLFISPDYQNAVVNKLTTSQVIGGELGYRHYAGIFEFSLGSYATITSGENENFSYYDDLSSQFVNMEMRDYGRLYSGVELGMVASISPRLTLRTIASASYNVYRNDPLVKITSDKSGKVVAENSTSLLKNYRLSATPQRVASMELKYSGSNMWMASIAANYVGDSYVSANPVRRMQRVLDRATSPEMRSALSQQERYANAVTINLFFSKSFAIKSQFLTLSCSINNITNSREIVNNGYEPMRLSYSGVGLNRTLSPRDSKYYYAYPRTFYLTINFRL